MTGSSITYCTNIHPGVSWDEHFQELKQFVLPVKKGLKADYLYLGLRLSAQMADDLSFPKNLTDFKDWCLKNQVWPSSFNTFPIGSFHNVEVKEQVYQPDWSKKARLNFSLSALKLASHFANADTAFSLSTVPVSYRPLFENEPIQGYTTLIEAARNLARWAYEANQLHKTSSKLITLDLEPEPDCLLDDVETTLDFFNNYLLTFGKEYLMSECRLSESEAISLLKQHIGLCFDTCHFSVRYLNLINSFKAIYKAGISINKVQISAAISAKPNQRKQLSTFAEPVYLHQTFGLLPDDSVKGFRDLPQALASPIDIKEFRSHFHLPLYYSGSEPIGTTAHETAQFIKYLKGCNYKGAVEIETYTYSVWPGFLKKDLHNSIIQEFEWVKKIIS